jgi:Mg-chelatase subunit ChlD
VRAARLKPWAIRLSIAALAGAAGLVLIAWDTKDTVRRGAGAAIGTHQADSDHAKWAALYHCHQISTSACQENEHAWLAQLALDMAAPGSPWGLTPDTALTVHDLNGGYFRREIGAIEGAWPDPAPIMGIPQRTLPGAANFAGIPDFSYTMYDWINKNELCPPVPGGGLPAGTPGDCHNYTIWQGGGFNASHFGSQATRSYQRLHATALGLAARAASLRSRASTPADLELHRDAIREAELMALAYEGYAQHFLQDRWAMGHMFERWGAPEYNAGATALNPVKAVLTGGFTGIIHGHQSVTGVPDALSSPEVGLVNTAVQSGSRFFRGLIRAVGIDVDAEPPPSSISIPVWRHQGDTETYPGVGDYRAGDMHRRQYAARITLAGQTLTYNGEVALPVGVQEQEFMACSAAGYRAVIEAFGSNSDGGYGVDAVAVNTGVPASQGPRCFDVWATNASMLAGFGAEFALAGGISDLARSSIRYALPAGIVIEATDALGLTDVQGLTGNVIATNRIDAAEMTRILTHAALRAYVSADGLDLAQGGLGTMMGVQTGDRFAVASYLEPTDLSTLPETDGRGRDARAVFGFFNRANSEYFCSRSANLLPNLRRSSEDHQRATCRILAQRIYRGVREDSTVIDEYLSVVLDGERQAAAPLCAISSAGWSAPAFGGDGLEELHPGYVAWNFRDDQSRAFSMDDEGLAYRSVANWCDETPVVDFLDGGANAGAGIVAVLEDTRDTLSIEGLHFGVERGELRIGQTPESAQLVTAIESWSDRRIRFSIEDIYSRIAFNDAHEAYIFVLRAEGDQDDPGRQSVGRFALLREVRPPEVAEIEVRGNERRTYYRDIAPVTSDQPGWQEGRSIFDQPAPPEPDAADQAFQPIPGGEHLRVQIRFDTDMERDAEGEAFLLGSQPLEGNWINARTWRASADIPSGAEYDAMRGGQTISIFARSARGAWTDGDPRVTGEEPDTTHQLLLDEVPVYVSSFELRGGGRTIYAASWQGGPDYEAAPSLTQAALGNPERVLDVATARAAPPSGRGEVRLELSREIETAPELTIGGASVTLQGEGRRWRGPVDFEAAATRLDANGDLQAEIRMPQTRLDADPRTAAVINEPQQWPRRLYWAGLESERGGAIATDGGADIWHRIGPPPALSLLIILDGSGSMGGESERMVNAKAGIAATLDNLPTDQIIELAVVSFNECGSLSSMEFTRDLDQVRSRVASIVPDGGTPLAEAHGRARQVFASSADPRAQQWRYATFTDGAETCDGNVVAQARELDALINRHRAPDSSPPDQVAQATPEPPIACESATWRGYEVRVRDGGRHLDTISLLEHSYLERALPDGRCIARHETRTYGVYYGSIRARSSGPARARWGVNSQASETSADFGTSRLGEADLLRVRNGANAQRRSLVTLERARQQIQTAVEAASPESG